MDKAKIPLNDLYRHTAPLADRLTEAASRVIQRGGFLEGTEAKNFATSFAAYCGTEYAVGVANGTDALEIALRAIGVTSGSRVVTVANAGYYATTAILAIGAIPVYVDVEISTQLMSIDALNSCLMRGDVRAVVVTHLYGRLADMKRISQLCSEANIPVVEDCAQAHGASLNGRRAGSFGVVSCYSFYPTKNKINK